MKAACPRYWQYRKNRQLTLCIDSTLLYKYRLLSPPQRCEWPPLRLPNYLVDHLSLGSLVKTSFHSSCLACDCWGLLCNEMSQHVYWPRPFLPVSLCRYDVFDPSHDRAFAVLISDGLLTTCHGGLYACPLDCVLDRLAVPINQHVFKLKSFKCLKDMCLMMEQTVCINKNCLSEQNLIHSYWCSRVIVLEKKTTNFFPELFSSLKFSFILWTICFFNVYNLDNKNALHGQ